MSNTPNPITEAARAGRYPSRKFNKRERKLIKSATSYTPGAVVAGAPAGFTAQPTSIEGALDQLAVQGSSGLKKTVKVVWDQSVSGGTIGTIDLGSALPSAAVVTEVITDVQVSPTGTAGGTITLNVPTDGNLAAAVTAGDSVACVGSFKTAPVKTTASRELQATIATHALTAGKVTWFITYLQSA